LPLFSVGDACFDKSDALGGGGRNGRRVEKLGTLIITD
jgi:hypothetical protein